MKIVCISDTHGAHEKVDIPDGDVIVHAGDLTSRGGMRDLNSFHLWFKNLPHKHKIVIAGNHDFCFENENKELSKQVLSDGCIYLQDSGIEIDGINFWGTPWQPWFHDWAFNLKTEKEREIYWDLIPRNTDVLLVHGPPQGNGDLCMGGDRPGCRKLRDKIRELQPKIVVTGHIHEDYGEHKIGDTDILNASIMDFRYNPVNHPMVVEL
tara:strand:- start:67612 stop:68238 length:627 start_codon:yes stop_codon:yes gene_type:complete